MDQPGIVISLVNVDTRKKMVESNKARGQTADVDSRDNVNSGRICRKTTIVLVTILSLNS